MGNEFGHPEVKSPLPPLSSLPLLLPYLPLLSIFLLLSPLFLLFSPLLLLMYLAVDRLPPHRERLVLPSRSPPVEPRGPGERRGEGGGAERRGEEEGRGGEKD
eukprot:755658-Hanusia_phi.AAC.1